MDIKTYSETPKNINALIKHLIRKKQYGPCKENRLAHAWKSKICC